VADPQDMHACTPSWLAPQVDQSFAFVHLSASAPKWTPNLMDVMGRSRRSAAAYRHLGTNVPASAINSAGYTVPRLRMLPCWFCVHASGRGK
jgi:hypothetical protein